jgi:CCR4-NOT transcription complex subunit 2
VYPSTHLLYIRYNRHWRYHKELGLWLTKETDENGRPAQVFSRRASPNGLDRGVYVFFDPTTWQKVKREWTLSWDAIEERNSSPAANTPVVSNASTLQQQQQQQQQQNRMQ